MSIERYGVALGRLWMQWPHFEPRDLWIGLFWDHPYYEMGHQRRNFYVCVIPTIVFTFTWDGGPTDG